MCGFKYFRQQVTQAGEMLILTFGIQLAYASRNSPIKGVSWVDTFDIVCGLMLMDKKGI